MNGIAVSAQRAGVLPISQQSTFVLSSIGYHGYEGLALNDDEKSRLIRDLSGNIFLMLRNHGLLTVGETVAEAFARMYFFETVCTIQVRAQACGGELIPVDQKVPRALVQSAGLRRPVASARGRQGCEDRYRRGQSGTGAYALGFVFTRCARPDRPFGSIASVVGK